jgi:hypothetical protein
VTRARVASTFNEPTGALHVKRVRTILREDFGALDPNLVRTELLAAAGVHDVAFEPTSKGLSIEYDPEILTPPKLLELMCRCGVYPVPQGSRPDAAEPDEG